jgi:hypothetical protein
MTTKIGLSLTTYEILDVATNPLDTTPEEEDEWVTTSASTIIKPNITLYMRSPGVEVCLGLRSRKRALSIVPEPPFLPSPRFAHLVSEAFYLTDVILVSPANTPSPSKRIRSDPVTVSALLLKSNFVLLIPRLAGMKMMTSLCFLLRLLQLDLPGEFYNYYYYYSRCA